MLISFSINPSLSSHCSLSPSLLSLPSPSWHSALSLIVDNWVGGAVGRPCLCVQRASGQVNGALVSSQEHSVSLFFSVRSLTRPVNFSLSVNFSFLSQLMLFLTVSIYFYPISSCHPSYFLLAPQGFLSHFSLPPSHCLFHPFCLSPLFASVCRFSISSLCLLSRTDLFQIS